MFGFPVNSQADIETFTNNADSGFPKIQQREIFYSVKNGSWNDTTIWQTASGRVGIIPGQFDDVYIRHSIQTPQIANYICNSNKLFILQSGGLTYLSAGANVIVNDRIVCRGFINITNAQQQFLTINTTGEFDELSASNFIGISLVLVYSRIGDQKVLQFNPAFEVRIAGSGIKTLSSNVTIGSNLFIASGTLDLSIYDLVVNGTTNIQTKMIKTGGGGNILFIGNLYVQNASNVIDFSFGNPNVECRGGITSGVSNFPTSIISGTGTWSFTTNNQTINTYNPYIFDANIVIGSNVTLTVGISGGGFSLNNTINGTDGTSRLLMNSGTINFNTLASVTSMTTGIVDFTTNVNTIGYVGNYTATIPSYFTTFHNLTISGTGTKSLGVNTTLNGNLILAQSSAVTKLELGNYDITINGTTQFSGYTGSSLSLVPTLSKSGPGNVIFVGEVNYALGKGMIDFSVGNPNVEMRNGINANSYTWNNYFFKSGTGTWSFTTNNQNIRGGYGSEYEFYGPVLIKGAITLSLVNTTFSNGSVRIYDTINGDNANSKLYVGGAISTSYFYLCITNSNTIMSTGIFDFTTSVWAGMQFENTTNYTIPYSTFQNLSITGTSGIKTLSANTTTQYLIVQSSATFECSSFDLSVNGITELYGGTFSKNGAGNILFNGGFYLRNNGCKFYLNGNPNVEFKNIGYSTSNLDYNPGNFTSGNGQWKFSTNNQIIGGSFFRNNPIDASILIDGAITLTASNNISGQETIYNNVINGNNASSKFLINTNTIINYKSPTQPMVTGILDTSTNANTWIYGNSNQDVKGNTYRNLTFNGGGTKTLQGNVSVLNTYTLTAPATVNLNGFTLTNP